MNPSIRDYLMQKKKEREALQTQSAPNGLQALSNAFATISTGFAGKDPSQAWANNQKNFDAANAAKLNDFDKSMESDIQGIELGRNEDKYNREQKSMAEDSDPNSQQSKLAQQVLKSMNMPGDLSGLTYEKFKTLSPVVQKKYELEQDRIKKMQDRSKPENSFKALPVEKQKVIEGLGTKNANKIAISNQIDSVMNNWDNLSDDQKVTQGRQLIKVLNSTEGADAVGSEEAKRLGSKLEFAMGNLFNSNPVQWGRDLEGFKEQANLTSKGIKGAIKSNNSSIDEAYGRAPVKTEENTKMINGKKYKKVTGGWEEV